MKKIFQLTFESHITGIKVNGISINNLRYADDTTILASGATNYLERYL
jgi:hypothetical protein